MGNLAQRFLVAVVAVPILVLAMYATRPEYMWGLVFAVSTLAMYEFFCMALEDKADRIASLVLGVATVAMFYWMPADSGGHAVAMATAAIPACLYYLFRFGDMNTALRRLSATIAGIVYAGVLLTFLALIKKGGGAHGGDFILLILAIAWIGDTGAYFAGRFLGKTKLYPAVSPGKTWAGAVGGLLGATGATVAIKILLFKELGWLDAMAIAIPGAALGQMGDLVESVMKRSAGVKDSGALLPGHGGILDRVDAVLFIAPYTYCYLYVKAALA